MKFSNLVAFLTFAAYTDYAWVEKQFGAQHEKFQSGYPHWSINATHRKLKAAFWYDTAFKHYATLCLVAAVALTVMHPGFWANPLSLLVALVCIVFIFIPIAAFIYMPSYFSTYLPLLESCIEHYSGKQKEGIQKCKQQQYPVMALMLIQYAFNEIAGVKTNLLTDSNINLMAKQYGVSQKMIDITQRIIVLNQWDYAKERKRTEILGAFEIAADYFENMEIHSATKSLESLKTKLLFHTKIKALV